jgi:Ca2+-binding RTX toxin-like protein
LIRFETVEEEIGGRDRVDAGQGDNVVLGGTGRDDLTAGDGNDVILGDLGTILAVDGVTPDVTARNIGIGDDDIINAGNGDNVVMGGAGNDAVTTGSGVDLIAGDGGRLTRNMLGALVRFETVEEDVGGADTIMAGDGDNVVLAGTGADTVSTGAGADIVLGDLGLVARDDAGCTQVIGRNIGVGGNDILEA